MIVDLKPSMCLGKKKSGHALQEMRCRNKHLLGSRPLKDSLCAKPVRSRVDNLQKRRIFVLKNNNIITEPDRTTQGYRPYKD